MKNVDNADIHTLGGRIRFVRITRKLSQTEFGAKIRAKTKTVSRWECDQSIPSATYIAEICRKYGISPAWLLGLKK